MRILNLLAISLMFGLSACAPKPRSTDIRNVAKADTHSAARVVQPDTAVWPVDIPSIRKAKTFREYKSALTEQDWINALESIPMLPLDSLDTPFYPNLPRPLINWLLREGYAILQYDDSPDNYFDAQLFEPGVTDWVVLASKDHVSKIIIFRGGSPDDTLSLFPAPDRDYLEYEGEGRFEYYRQVRISTKEGILHDIPQLAAPDAPFRIEYDGLDLTYAIPGGGNLYFFGGEWHRLPGECYTPPRITMDIWEAASREVYSLPPSAFPDLPAWVAGWLNQEGYVIPQYSGDKNPHNVISGEFYKAGEKCWAVLALKNPASRIVVFREGHAPDTTLSPPENNNDHQQYEGDIIVFTRLIRAADSSYINKYFVLRDTQKRPSFPLTHEGIDDIIIDRYSVVFYHHAGKWWLLDEKDDGEGD